jgi:hypothetical protein
VLNVDRLGKEVEYLAWIKDRDGNTIALFQPA